MNKKDKWYDEIESTVCVVMMIFMLAILFFQVIARYLFGYSLAWIDELSRYSLVWIAYLSAVYAITKNAHIKIDMVLGLWPKKIRKSVQLLSNVIFFLYAVVIAYYSTLWVIDLNKAGSISMGMGVRMSYFSVIIPLSHILMAIRLVQLHIRQIKNPELLELIDEADAAIEEANKGRMADKK